MARDNNNTFMGGGGDWTFWLRWLLRLLQFLFCLVAIVTLAAGFASATYYGYTSMLTSSGVLYAFITTYTGMVVALWLMLIVMVFALCGRPTLFFEQLMDFILGVMLLVAAIIVLTGDYVQHCSVYGFMLRCSPLRASVVFMFLAMAAYFASVLLGFVEKRRNGGSDSTQTQLMSPGHEGHTQGPYVTEATPTHHDQRGSPKGGATDAHSRV